MTNFNINFTYPWLLLLIIPIAFLALFPHFRVAKKYRRTRNRITSLVLHCVIMVLSVLVLAGMTFEYDVPNNENEILLLVDASHSTRESQTDKNNFVKSVIDYSDSRYKVGVVTFGFDQVYAAPLSYDGDEVYKQYVNAKLPDTTATDLEAALNYARGLLQYPETSKIVIVSDGIETDGKAMSVIRSIAADGIHVDTRYIHENTADDIQLIGVDLPDYTVIVNEVFNVSVKAQSSYTGAANLTLYDNGEAVTSKTVKFNAGIQSISLEHSFSKAGMHALSFVIESPQGDTLNENNIFNSYIYLETYDKLLVLESNAGESDNLVSILEKSGFSIDVVDIHDTSAVPSTLAGLCAYDQVIMMNIANADMPIGFDEILNSYVYEIGGGMFTVGGNKIGDNGQYTANAYNRDDMLGTLYQNMLPVQAIDYTPPLGLMIIIDRSGSMGIGDSSGKSRLDAAKDGAFACLDVLSERDWVGVMSLESSFQSEIDLTPATQKTIIREAIDKIVMGGATMFSPAIKAAGQALNQLDTVERKHIILITDGLPGEADDVYGAIIQENFAADITFSVVGISIADGSTAAIKMENAVSQGGGRFHSVMDLSELRNTLRDELTLDVIQQYVPKEFTPVIRTHTSAVVGITELPALGGYYGTRLKSDATAVLVGDYVPVYAQWKYGKGMVGSFMSDLKGSEDSWSQTFLSSEVGVKFINNVVNSLFPTSDIRPTDIKLEMVEQNYKTQMSIFTALGDDESIDVTIYKTSSDGMSETVAQTFKAGANEDYSRVSFTLKEAGVYRILVQKLDSQGKIISSNDIYKTFSYSKEYDVFIDNAERYEFMTSLAELGGGGMIDEASDVFFGFVDKLHKVVNPGLAMLIIVLLLFLMDIAVRKFKFKWPHELIREHKNRNKS